MADVRAASPGIPETGQIVSGKFRIEEPLGRGGLGVVVAATHLQLGQRVAIKFLDARVLAAVDGVARFLREARSAATIESEHCVRILDFGTAEDGAPYIVMECLRGHDLATELREHGALEVERAVDYVLQACDAVAEAHAHGIIHRDLKPANLFLARREARGSLKEGALLVKVLDFGVAKVLDEGDGRMGLTGESAVIGTSYYMAPEQVRDSSRVDARTDVWALGVILFELLTGERPFDGPTASAVTAAIVADPPRLLDDVRPDVPPAIRAVIAKCLAKDPARRWPDVRAFAQALEDALGGSARLRLVRPWSETERGSAGRLVVSTAPVSSPEALAATELASSESGQQVSEPVSERADASPRRSRAPIAIAAVLGVGLAVGWAVRALAPSTPPEPVRATVDAAASTVASVLPSVTASVEPPPPVTVAITSAAPPASSARGMVHAPRIGTKPIAPAPPRATDPKGIDDPNLTNR
ncbi:MAG: protein kinase [Labilithrix sp.]